MLIRTLASSGRLLLSAVALTGAAAVGVACSGSSGGSGSSSSSGGGSGSSSSGGGSGSSTSSGSSSSGSGSGGSSSSGSSGGDDGGGADPFVGSWVCAGSETNTYTAPAGKAPTTTSFTDDVTITANGDGTQTASSVAADGGGNTCVVKSTVSGDTSTLESGQTCLNASGTTATYTSGSSTLTSSTTFTSMRAYTFAGTVTYTPDGGSPTQVQVAGSGTSSSTCTKQ